NQSIKWEKSSAYNFCSFRPTQIAQRFVGRVVAAIRHYRAALDVAENLEREDACAHRALTSTLLDLERALRGEAAPHLNNNLFETGSTAVARSDKTWADLVEATARLDSARRTLAALERQLGYLPKVSRGADHK
ncbi:hypothetical protein, partial [Bradyrhizobium genomosp. III]